jgi:hypothetical protein
MATRKKAEPAATTDHKTIRQWVEERGGTPAAVKATHRPSDPGILRIMFPKAPHADDDSLEEISWDEFFEKFDDAGLAPLYEETTADGEQSLFNKLVSRETAGARPHGKSRSTRRK